MRPIFVDLDGCLVRSDTLHENIIAVVKKNVLFIFLLPLWLLKGKAGFKAVVASKAMIDPSHLPYNQELLHWLKEKKRKGHSLYLATAANERIAKAVCDHLAIFDGFLASTNTTNLSGKSKKAAIKNTAMAFDYIGDCMTDVHIWDEAQEAIAVGNNGKVRRYLATHKGSKTFFDNKNMRLIDFFHALRAHQWAKNLLLFLPIFLAHELDSAATFAKAFLAFACFSLLASATYLVNDLLDIEADRQHQIKRRRPLASGLLTLKGGVGLALVFLLLGFGLSAWLLPVLLPMLVIYFLLTLAYSLKLKKKVMLDVLTLASLYAWRVLAGGVATGIPISPWLISFSTFFFLSLALSKRSSELFALTSTSETVAGRGYLAQDLSMINAMGIATAMASLVIFSLYIYNPLVTSLYASPQMLWLEVLLLTYWIGRLWILTGRGQLHQDPVEFALKDKQSYVVGLLMVAAAAIAASPLLQ